MRFWDEREPFAERNWQPPDMSTMNRTFVETAHRYFTLRLASRVGPIGGYGANGEIVYDRQPRACPSVLMDATGEATATFMTNGSLAFGVRDRGRDVTVLAGSFDAVEKHEIGLPAANVWLDIRGQSCATVAALQTPGNGIGCPPHRVRIVKCGDPRRAMWYLAEFRPAPDLHYRTCLAVCLVDTPAGPAILRRTMVENLGARTVTGNLWTCWRLPGTQQFVYNKSIWYDSGLPLTDADSVVAATVPYCDELQIKRVSSAWQGNIRPVAATCDYLAFVGDSGASLALPEAVRKGALLAAGAGQKLNRFSTPVIAANQFRLRLDSNVPVVLNQTLLYVTASAPRQAFRRAAQSRTPDYAHIAKALHDAAAALVRNTPGCEELAERDAAPTAGGGRHPAFAIELPQDGALAFYANSIWTGVEELYANCRAHGAKLADGIELGTRDRGQDMWPKLRQDPARVRRDLLYALSFMYRTVSKPISRRTGLTLREKLHGMFPRQYPSQWRDRTQPVMNDNRPYADSPLWLIDALIRLIRETGDRAILDERVGSVTLTDPDNPEQSGIVGGAETLSVMEVALEVFAAFERLCDDSPYGMAQIMYGDWCDPIDMFGTSVVGDATTRGRGTGVQTRLSAHVFMTVVDFVDVLEALGALPVARLARLQAFADRLRQSIVATAWEGGRQAGFIDCIHTLNRDGSRPDHAAGELGYTLGSMRRRREFDGIPRRVLVSQAWGLAMLSTERPWLRPVAGGERMVRALLRTVDTCFFDATLGLKLFTTPLANDEQTLRLAGRMGVLPSGCAENGEYHHAQAMLHHFRMRLPGQLDGMWNQFRPMLSASRGLDLNGPFDMACTSYASDPDDPHFGAGMYFGLSGSTDWLVDIFERLAGIRLDVHDPALPDLRIRPLLPRALGQALSFRRVLHVADGRDGYRPIPLTIHIAPLRGQGRRPTVHINGQPVSEARVEHLREQAALDIRLTVLPV